MAFTGSATIQIIADGIARITGLSLAAGAAGTISLSAGSGQVLLPAYFKAAPYVAEPSAGTVPTSASIDVTAKASDASTPLGGDARVTKVGNGVTDFLATLTNMNLASATASLEIYVKFHS
jgi:hypothetical protein